MKIILVDDHKIIRDGLRSLLEKQPDIEIIAEAEDGVSAVNLARELKPDVIIMDIGLPVLNGIEATRKITAENPNIKVISLSICSDRWSLEKMIKAGASGYVLKNSAFEELVQAVNTVMDNEFYLCLDMSKTIVNDFVGNIKNSGITNEVISAREREVLQLIAEGKTVGEIAACLNISKKTVEVHRSQIYNKLGMSNLADIIKYAIREGLTSIY